MSEPEIKTSQESGQESTARVEKRQPERLSRKGAETRQRILDTALDLFRERGFEQTTMRAIAEAAAVSLGNAYYYFRSKEHLIQGFYARTHVEHLAACVELLEQETDLKVRLAGVIRAKIETADEYHRFSAILFKSAADPESPLHPMSADSKPVRDDAIELMAEVVNGSTIRVQGALGEELPQLLWLYLMGIILFWVHDRSEGCRRTHRLIDRTVDIVVRLIHLANLPPLRPLVRSVLALLEDIKTDVGEDTSSAETSSAAAASSDDPLPT